jgi:sigma-B regulation protein RsbU (phosphoserine phosphatase)
VPSLEISGDFYDFVELPGDNLGLAICDVMGKGIPAGLLMAAVRASLRAHAGDLYDLSEILRRVNQSLYDDTLTSSFATLFYGVVNVRAMELTYANGGHEPPLLIRGDEVRSLTSGGTVLGVERDARYAQQVVKLCASDALVLTTDGVVEAVDFKDVQFGRHRVQEAARSAIRQGRDANGIARHILWEMRRFVGLRERGDDVTMVVVRIT